MQCRPWWGVYVFASVACAPSSLTETLPASEQATTSNVGCSPLLPKDVPLRVVSANLATAVKTGSNGNRDIVVARYDQHGQRILASLQPDILLLQECIFENDTTQGLEAYFQPIFFNRPVFWYRPQLSRAVGGAHPDCIVSAYPFVERGFSPNRMGKTANQNNEANPANDENNTHGRRNAIWVRFLLPSNRNLWVVTAHFSSPKDGNDTPQVLQAQALVQGVEALTSRGNDDLVIFGGDLNTISAESKALRVLANFFVVPAAGDEPVPMDRDRATATNTGRTTISDWLLITPPLVEHEQKFNVGNDTFDHGFIFDTRTYSPSELTEIFAEIPESLRAREEDSRQAMTHMALLRTFSF